MNKGDKVLCVSADPAWRKISKPAPKAGWVYLVKSIAAFDAEGKPADIGVKTGISLEGIESKRGPGAEFFAAYCFRLLVNKPCAKPKRAR